MDALGIIGAVVGIVGGLAGVASVTYNVLHDRKRDRLRLRVKLDDTGFIINEDVKFVLVSAHNVGFRPIILQQAGIILPSGHVLTTFEPVLPIRFPVHLSAGESCDFTIDARHLANAIKAQGYGSGIQLRGYYRDALDTIYCSKPHSFDPERFIGETKA